MSAGGRSSQPSIVRHLSRENRSTADTEPYVSSTLIGTLFGVVEPLRNEALAERVGSAYAEYKEHVFRVLRRCGVPAADADDLTHEVFVVLLRRIEEQRDPAALRGWLFQTARRIASNYRRGSDRERRRLEKLAEPEETTNLDEQVARSEAATFIARFVGELDDNAQQLFLMSEVEGLRGPEVASQLQINQKDSLLADLRASAAIRAGRPTRVRSSACGAGMDVRCTAGGCDAP